MPRVPPPPVVPHPPRVFNPPTRGVVPYGYSPWRYGWQKVSPDGLYNAHNPVPSNIAAPQATPPVAPYGSGAVLRQLQAMSQRQQDFEDDLLLHALNPIQQQLGEMNRHLHNVIMTTAGGVKIKDEPEYEGLSSLFGEPEPVPQPKPAPKPKGKGKGKAKSTHPMSTRKSRARDEASRKKRESLSGGSGSGSRT
jgi:hypothetical protein